MNYVPFALHLQDSIYLWTSGSMKFKNIDFALKSEAKEWQKITSSNCSCGVAISSTGTPNQTSHACDMPIGPTCTDTPTHRTADEKYYQTPIFPRTHHSSPKPLSVDRSPPDGQPMQFSDHYSPSWSCTYWIYPKPLQSKKTNKDPSNQTQGKARIKDTQVKKWTKNSKANQKKKNRVK